MRNKFLILTFGLLLAVGWTNDASAQLLAKYKTDASHKSTMYSMKREIGHSGVNKGLSMDVANLKSSLASKEVASLRPEVNGTTFNAMNQEQQQFRAPLRSNDFSTTEPGATHIKSWYEQQLPNPYVTWNGGSQLITEPFTDVDGMMALVKRVYTDKNIPGAKYTATLHRDIPYQTIQRGWNIIGTYGDIYIEVHPYVAIYQIEFYDSNMDLITYWSAYNSGTSFPSTWTTSGQVGSADGVPFLYPVDGYMGVLTIPSTYLQSLNETTGVLNVQVWAYNWYGADYVSSAPLYIGTDMWGYSSYNPDYSETDVYGHRHGIIGTIESPDECGYTVMLVKLYDGKNQDGTPPYEALDYTTSESELREYFTEYIKEIDLLTDGLRVNEGTDDAGTLFAYTGDLSRFYFISKGKMAYMTSLDTIQGDLAPFYSMYEEFSPAVEGGSEDHTDFYTELRKGVTYPIVHDCQSVNYLQHYFSMSGKHGTDENRVNSLVLYIPDNRGNSEEVSRTYVTNHQPTVGMYMVDLFADIEPAAQEGYYQTTVTWEDNLDAITHSDGIPQTYYLYQVIGNDTICVTPNGTDQTTWNSADDGRYYPAGDAAYEIHYFVVAIPTDATNPDIFHAQSAPDNVTVPGTSDFIGLQWWRYESDYVTKDTQNTEVNYYRNWLAPHKLSVQGQAGISAGNVGTTGRTLTLYRNETPVIDLELVMNSNKAYYRIKYRDASNQEIEPGYKADGEIDPNYNPNND